LQAFQNILKSANTQNYEASLEILLKCRPKKVAYSFLKDYERCAFTKKLQIRTTADCTYLLSDNLIKLVI